MKRGKGEEWEIVCWWTWSLKWWRDWWKAVGDNGAIGRIVLLLTKWVQVIIGHKVIMNMGQPINKCF